MRISLVRTGGVGGIRREATIDTETLEPSRADQLLRLLERADLERLGARSESSGRPDRFCYALTLEEGEGRRREIVFREEDASEIVQRLIETVWHEAETEPPDVRRA